MLEEQRTEANPRRLQRALQRGLDNFHYARKHFITVLAYCSMRLYGFEITYSDVWAGTYGESGHNDRQLENAGDVDLLLDVAKEGFKTAVSRRVAIGEKCKTLLTLSSLLLALVGVLLPKSLAFEFGWMRGASFLAVLFLLNTVMLLLVFFDVRSNMEISLDQSEVNLDRENLKKNLVNLHLRCQSSLDRQTDYLADVFKTARFFFLFAFTVVVGLFSLNFLTHSPSDQTQRVIQELRSNSELAELLRGPKGEKGDDGRDATVDNDALIDKVLADPRMLERVEEAVKKSASADNGITPE